MGEGNLELKIENASRKNSDNAYELEKTLFKYVIFGSGASIIFILTIYKDGLESKTFNDFLDLQLVLFTSSLILAIIGMFLSIRIRLVIGELLSETFRIELDKEEVSTVNEDNLVECASIADRSKENLKGLKKYWKLLGRVTTSFMFSSGLIFLIAFVLAIYSVVKL